MAKILVEFDPLGHVGSNQSNGLNWVNLSQISVWYGDRIMGDWNNQFRLNHDFIWFNLTHLGQMGQVRQIGSIDQIEFDYGFNHIWSGSWGFELNQFGSNQNEI